MPPESLADAHHVSVTLMGRWEGGPEFSIKSYYDEALWRPGTDEILPLLKGAYFHRSLKEFLHIYF